MDWDKKGRLNTNYANLNTRQTKQRSIYTTTQPSYSRYNLPSRQRLHLKLYWPCIKEFNYEILGISLFFPHLIVDQIKLQTLNEQASIHANYLNVWGFYVPFSLWYVYVAGFESANSKNTSLQCEWEAAHGPNMCAKCGVSNLISIVMHR